MSIIQKIKRFIVGTEDKEEANYPPEFGVIKWKDGARQSAVNTWRSKFIAIVRQGKTVRKKQYFPRREKVIEKTRNIPIYDETGGQSKPEVPTHVEEEPSVIKWD